MPRAHVHATGCSQGRRGCLRQPYSRTRRCRVQETPFAWCHRGGMVKTATENSRVSKADNQKHPQKKRPCCSATCRAGDPDTHTHTSHVCLPVRRPIHSLSLEKRSSTRPTKLQDVNTTRQKAHPSFETQKDSEQHHHTAAAPTQSNLDSSLTSSFFSRSSALEPAASALKLPSSSLRCRLILSPPPTCKPSPERTEC